MAVELEVTRDLSDEEYLRELVGQILPKVQEAIDRKSLQVVEDSSDPDILPIGGNIERQQSSGLNLIRDLCTKLESINSGPIDLASVDYNCLERVLEFLQRRGENWTDEIQRIKEIRSNNI